MDLETTSSNRQSRHIIRRIFVVMHHPTALVYLHTPNHVAKSLIFHLARVNTKQGSTKCSTFVDDGHYRDPG